MGLVKTFIGVRDLLYSLGSYSYYFILKLWMRIGQRIVSLGAVITSVVVQIGAGLGGRDWRER